jgi:hypothetical protein
MNDWNIQARSRLCQGCGRTFADREAYHTLLFEQRSGLERLDVCGGCWEGQHRHGAKERKGFISHWQGVFLAPAAAAPEAIRKDSAEALLRRLLELKDPVWQPAAFILAVMLERKRVLKAREQIRANGKRTFVYEEPKTGEMFVVVDPALQLDQLAQVQHDVAHLLEHGLPGDAEPGVPVEEPFVPVMAGVDPAAAAEPGTGGVEGGDEARGAHAEQEVADDEVMPRP